MTFVEYLRELEHAQTDRQTNGKQKHFSTLLENVKKGQTVVESGSHLIQHQNIVNKNNTSHNQHKYRQMK